MRQERELLNQRESDIFNRFLGNCEKAYEDVFIGRLVNPFRKPWQEQEKEKPQLTVENPEESTPSCEQKEIDPLVISKYRAD